MGKAQKLKKLRKIEAQKEAELKKQKNKKRIIIYSLISVLVVGIIISLVFFVNYLNEKDIRRVVIETEKGEIKLELYPKVAPKTVENFIKLTKQGFYDGLTFHRVVEDFVIQGGDPKGDGTGGPGYTFEDEINPIALNMSIKETKELEKLGYKYRSDLESIPHETGVISMANSGPNTNGSQFFIITGPAQPSLDGRHTAFGRVYEGIEVARSIEQGDVMKRVYLLD